MSLLSHHVSPCNQIIAGCGSGTVQSNIRRDSFHDGHLLRAAQAKECGFCSRTSLFEQSMKLTLSHDQFIMPWYLQYLQVVIDLIVFVLMEEIGFYYSHRCIGRFLLTLNFIKLCGRNQTGCCIILGFTSTSIRSTINGQPP